MTSIGETFRVRPWVADAGKAGIGGGRPLPDVWLRTTPEFTRPRGRTGMTPDSQSGSCGFESRRGCFVHWTVDGRSKGVTEQRLTPKRCVGRNVHPASLRGEGISLAVHDGGWQACRRATDGNGKRSEQRAALFEGGKSLLPHHRLIVWLWGSVATPPASGAGDRRFDSCRPDCAVEERLSSRAS